MYKVSELLGKPLITLSEAKILGTVSNIFFDTKLCTGLYVSVTDEEFNNYYVPLKQIINLTFDAAVVAAADFASEINACPSPINSYAFNQDGKELGMVKDIVMDGLKVVSLIAGDNEYAAALLLNRSDDLVIINDSGAPMAIKKPARKKKNPPPPKLSPQPLPPTILPLPFEETPAPVAAVSVVTVPNKPQTTTVNPSGGREVYNYDFLLGKRLQKSIFGDKGALVGRENALISAEIIENARREGKLVQLALHSL